MLYIDPEICVNCDACMLECPIEAIYPDFDVPDKWKEWIEINRINSEKYPVINSLKEPLKNQDCIDKDK